MHEARRAPSLPNAEKNLVAARLLQVPIHERAAGPPPPPQPRLLRRSSRAAGRIVYSEGTNQLPSVRIQPYPSRRQTRKKRHRREGLFSPNPRRGSSVPRRRPARTVGATRTLPRTRLTRAPTPNTRSVRTEHPTPRVTALAPPPPRAPPATRNYRARSSNRRLATAAAAARRIPARDEGRCPP